MKFLEQITAADWVKIVAFAFLIGVFYNRVANLEHNQIIIMEQLTELMKGTGEVTDDVVKK